MRAAGWRSAIFHFVRTCHSPTAAPRRDADKGHYRQTVSSEAQRSWEEAGDISSEGVGTAALLPAGCPSASPCPPLFIWLCLFRVFTQRLLINLRLFRLSLRSSVSFDFYCHRPSFKAPVFLEYFLFIKAQPLSLHCTALHSTSPSTVLVLWESLLLLQSSVFVCLSVLLLVFEHLLSLNQQCTSS